MGKGYLDIAFCVNDRYMPFVTVCIKSIADTHKSDNVKVHILTDNITDRSRNRLLDEFTDYSQLEIHFYYVDDSPLNGLQAWSKYTWYRLLLPSVLPEDVEKLLYLDADTLVCDNLSDLFATDMDGFAVAGVVDPIHFHDEAYARCNYPAEKGYMCAGVLLVNLRLWRDKSLQAEMLEWAHKHPDIKLHDQDCINTVFQDSKKFLPLRYGVIDALFTEDKLYTPDNLDEIEAAVANPAIVHYAGKAPWFKDAARHFFHDRWHVCNSSLRHPAKMTYKSSGLLKLKIQIYDLLHPGNIRKGVGIKEIEDRLESTGFKHNVMCQR